MSSCTFLPLLRSAGGQRDTVQAFHSLSGKCDAQCCVGGTTLEMERTHLLVEAHVRQLGAFYHLLFAQRLVLNIQ